MLPRRTIKVGKTSFSMASSVFIVHSLPLFTNWFTLWTARCDGPQMWLHIPAFGARVISLNSSIAQRRGFSLAPFVSAGFSAPLCRPPTWSLIPATPVPFDGGSPLAPRKTPSSSTDAGNSHIPRLWAVLQAWNSQVKYRVRRSKASVCQSRKVWYFGMHQCVGLILVTVGNFLVDCYRPIINRLLASCKKDS